jgi:phosphatidate cytidylyltransferase
MLVGFVLVLSLGHFYVSLLVLFLIFKMYQEVSAIKRYYEKENEIPITPFLTWYVFGISIYYSIGKLLLVKMPVVVLNHPILMVWLKYHNFVSFLLWISALLLFVFSLQKGYMKYQFRVFGWTCVAMILIVVPGTGMLFDLYEGLCWFLLPTLLIICNDIFAYLVGYFFGKTQLISLSPKKTWEGYIGGAVITFFASLLVTTLLKIARSNNKRTTHTAVPADPPYNDSLRPSDM